MNAAYEETHHTRELEHAKWRVNFVEFLLKTHRSLLLKDDDWKREETELLQRLATAKEQLEKVSGK